jgi:hypothetical protein
MTEPTEHDAAKRCTKCGQIKPRSEFPRDAQKRDGLRCNCKRCDATRGRTYRAANRERESARQRTRQAKYQAATDAIKQATGCIDCGTTEGRLDFDHRDDKPRLFIVADGWKYPWDVALAEIAKCDVRCASCHSKRHNPGGSVVRGPAKVVGGVIIGPPVTDDELLIGEAQS